MLARGEPCAVAVLVSGRFSRGGPGSKLVVSGSGEMAGTFPVALEEPVARVARAVLEGAPGQLLELENGFAVWVARRADSGGRFAQVALVGGRACEVTLLAGASPGAKLVVEPSGQRTGTLGAPELDDEAARVADELMWQEISERRGTMFFDVLVPPPRMLVFGAGEIARCLSELGAVTGWQVHVLDREAGEPEEAVARLGGIDRATSIVVISHDHDYGAAALALALRSPARFIGAMGSRRTQAARRERLLEAGFDAADWERVSAPVGLDLGAVEPRETALSVLAEAVAVRHGRSGGRVAVASGARA